MPAAELWDAAGVETERIASGRQMQKMTGPGTNNIRWMTSPCVLLWALHSLRFPVEHHSGKEHEHINKISPFIEYA